MRETHPKDRLHNSHYASAKRIKNGARGEAFGIGTRLVERPVSLRLPLKSHHKKLLDEAKLSSIVILNLIAKLPLLYHKPKNTGFLH